MKTSYSQNSTYVKCPARWWWQYKKRIESPEQGASLFFGSAIDDATKAMFEGKDDWLKVFNDKWQATYQNGKFIPIFDSTNVVYSYGDFDEHVLDEIDKETLKRWLKELNINPERLSSEGVEAFKAAAKIKRNPFKHLKEEELKYFNRCSWLCLRNKGKLLLEAFKEQVLPKITKVHSTQQHCSIKDEVTGDTIVGVIDLVAEVQGYDKPIILDIKTAARPYEDEDIDMTEQLAIYMAMKGQEYQTNLVGYLVMVKNIEKEKIQVCPKCGKIKDNRALTCDATVNGERCHTEWTETVKLKPQIQIMIKEKTPEEIQAVMQDQGNIITGMSNNIVYKNTDLCNSWFGAPCVYKGLCHKNDMTGLVEKESKK